MDTVVVVLGADCYKPLDVPSDCTVGLWKQLLGDGFLETPILYAVKLACRSHELGAVLEDASRLPVPPNALFVGGPTCILQMLELALRNKLGPPSLRNKLGPQTRRRKPAKVSSKATLAEGATQHKPIMRSAIQTPEAKVEEIAKQPVEEGSKLATQSPCSPPEAVSEKRENKVEKPIKAAIKPVEAMNPPMLSMFGGYRRMLCIGSGFEGDSVYLAQSLSDGSQAALKWPAKEAEVIAMRALMSPESVLAGRSDCLGIPRLLTSGRYAAAPFLVTELLGAELSKLFNLVPWSYSLQQRWHVISIVGRMAVRRLEALHRRGFVHCDISPENLLFDREPKTEASLFLIDLGLARRYPGGGPMRGDLGSAEWSSIRSANGGERRPEDDLEALGWVLMHGLLGQLPWLGILGDAYKRWHSPSIRSNAILQVQLSKSEMLQEMGEQPPDKVPHGLYRYLLACQDESSLPDFPDYHALNSFLGGTSDHDAVEAEEADLSLFRINVAPLF